MAQIYLAQEVSRTRVPVEQYNLTKTDDVGLGAKWGTLTGASVKYWYDESKAWDGTIAFENGNTAVGIDHEWHFRHLTGDVFGTKRANIFVPYLGAGLIGALGTHTHFFNRDTENFGLAARAPVGVEFLPTTAKFGLFAEVGFGFGFVPTNYSFISGDLGGRYYF